MLSHNFDSAGANNSENRAITFLINQLNAGRSSPLSKRMDFYTDGSRHFADAWFYEEKRTAQEIEQAILQYDICPDAAEPTLDDSEEVAPALEAKAPLGTSGEGVVVIANEDGSANIAFGDCSLEHRTAAGESIKIKADGTTIRRMADGTEFINNSPYGIEIIILPDGTEIQKHPNGDQVTTYGGDGIRIEKADGTNFFQAKGGTRITRKPDGTTIVEESNGTMIDFGPDGTLNTQAPDGKGTTLKPDGTIIVHHPKGGCTTFNSNGTCRQTD